MSQATTTLTRAELHVPTEEAFLRKHRTARRLPLEYLFPVMEPGTRVRYEVDTR